MKTTPSPLRLVLWSVILLAAPGLLLAASVIAQGNGPQTQVTINGDGTVSISFYGTPSTTYQIQSKGSLLDSNWNVVADNVIAIAGPTEWVDKSPDPAQRFYRVVSQPPTERTAVPASVASTATTVSALVSSGQKIEGSTRLRTWYVDRVRGNDAYDGQTTIGKGTSGPFATIAHALKQALPGDSVEVAAGRYHEDVDLSGRQIAFNFTGTVILH